jgi:glycosyltransferase involved in cell wall biosynthesis
MRIGMILPTKFPPDIRVEKEVRTLLKKHEVHLLCPKRGAQSIEENWNGLEIHRIFSKTRRWWNLWKLMATRYSRGWALEMDQFILKHNIEVLHVHDLPLLGTTLKVSEKHDIPVVVDLHENYPAMLEEDKSVPLKYSSSIGALVSRLSVSIPRWKAYEQEVVPKALRVITVVEEARDRLITLGVDRNRIHVVANYDSQEKSNDFSQTLKSDKKSPFRAVYAGGFGATRDLYTVVDALSMLSENDFPDFEVLLIGGQGKEMGNLLSYAESKGVTQRLSILKWLPRAEVEEIMCTANIGLVPHIKSAHTDSTIPHKLFQYMWRNLPVIVSDCTPLERIVMESGCGLVYQSGDAASLASCFSKLYFNREELGRYGLAGQNAVSLKYNWNEAGNELLKMYDDLLE